MNGYFCGDDGAGTHSLSRVHLGNLHDGIRDAPFYQKNARHYGVNVLLSSGEDGARTHDLLHAMQAL